MSGYENLDFFTMGKDKLSIRGKKIRLIELFAGIGSQLKALQNIGADVESHRLIEWDKFCIKSYNAIFGTDYETQDICEVKGEDLGIVDTDKYFYIMTYSFPCTDLSLRGKMEGMSRDDWEKGKPTRSGLLWEVERLLRECYELNGAKGLPNLLLMENVTQVHSKANKEDWLKWVFFLESLGYTNVWEDLNAKDFGVPQNRDRTFMVSFLGDYSYTFPKGFPLEKRLKDVLEDEVEESFYLDDSYIEKLSSDEEFIQRVRDEISRS